MDQQVNGEREREIAIECEDDIKTARDGERDSNCLEMGVVAGF